MRRPLTCLYILLLCIFLVCQLSQFDLVGFFLFVIVIRKELAGVLGLLVRECGANLKTCCYAVVSHSPPQPNACGAAQEGKPPTPKCKVRLRTPIGPDKLYPRTKRSLSCCILKQRQSELRRGFFLSITAMDCVIQS